MRDYLDSVEKQFSYYKLLGDRTFSQLNDQDIYFQPNASSNSIAIMVKHLWGNMLSRWTNFLTEDGEKTWRKRDEEFESSIQSKEELLEKWEEGWKCLFKALDGINEDNWHQLIYIRNQGHTITEAINRQLAHYSYHVGQIVYLGRLIKDQEWTSLSIAKGESKAYNTDKFSQEKKKGHFTDEYLNKKE